MYDRRPELVETLPRRLRGTRSDRGILDSSSLDLKNVPPRPEVSGVMGSVLFSLPPSLSLSWSIIDIYQVCRRITNLHLVKYNYV